MLTLLLETIRDWVNEAFVNFYARAIGYVTPEMYGAKGDGTTDDTEAFTRAFADSKHVMCNSNKTYYFAGVVDASQLTEGILDVNNATLNNFHIRVCLKNDNTTAFFAAGYFIFKNAILNSFAYKPAGWEIPAIQCGAYVHIENVKANNTPYLLAIPNVYRDQMIFRDIISGGDSSLWTGTTYALDAVNILKSDGTFARINKYDIAHEPSGQRFETNLAGDGWIVERVNEWRNRPDSDYAFCHFTNNRPITFIGCIQSKFVIGDTTRATFLDCHWESGGVTPEIYTLSDETTHADSNAASMVFSNCYFYNSYILETDNRNVTYENCYFRKSNLTTDAGDRTYTLAETLKNTDYYDMKCRLINCDFGCKVKIDTELFKRYKALPKSTRTSITPTSMNDTNDGIASNKTLTPSDKSSDSLYPMTGTYSYQILSYATGDTGRPHQIKNFTRVVESLNNIGDLFMHFKSGYGNGWYFEVYRTLPDDTIQRARFWFDPENYGYPTASYKVGDNGRYCTFVLVYSSTEMGVIEMDVIVPWITVNSIPTKYAYPNVYEKHGVLVSTDGQKISGLGSTSRYAQVDDNYVVNLPVATVKDVVATSADFADFQSKIALL